MSESSSESPSKVDQLASDAARVAIGLGLLGFQRAQVKRREIERSLAKTPLADVARDAAGALADVNRGAQRALDVVEDAAPEPVTAFIGLARTVTEDGARAIGSRVGPWIR